MTEVNGTATPVFSTFDLFIAYSAIMSMALLPIYVGSYLSLHRKKNRKEGDPQEESMTKKDAYMFPVIGSGVLFGLYILFRLFSKEYVNLLLTAYFLFFGFYSLAETFVPILEKIHPSLRDLPTNSFSFRLPWKDVAFNIEYNNTIFLSWFLSGASIVWYATTKNWLANNLLGLSFSVQGVSLISLGSYQVGCILLGGLFFYDIFWVFGTDVMVTVAKSFEAPIKLVFPKSLFAEQYAFTMLGLGDIVIPGIFIALLLRYDAHRARQKPRFPTPYFRSTFLGYFVGLLTTFLVMHIFQAAQPALLYLVPACLGFSTIQAFLLGDFHDLYAYSEEEIGKSDGKSGKSGKKENVGEKGSGKGGKKKKK